MIDQARVYLSRVLPAPSSDRGVCVALATGKSFLHALCDSVDAAAQQVQAWAARGSVYACLSLQKMMRAAAVGGAGLRSRRNAVALKALWLDIDCRSEAHKSAVYDSEEEALRAVVAAVRATPRMPLPTLVVSSGNGIHVYWTLDRELSPDQWQPLALGLAEWAARHGVAADRACTVDCARVLRVPGTLNVKTNTALPCEIVFDAKKDVDPALLPSKTEEKVQPVVSSAGLDVDLNLLTSVCPLLKHAKETGGAGHDYHAWLPMIWGAAFIEQARPGVGRTWAHALSCKHEDYSPAVVDRALDDALRRLTTDLAGAGWPTCAAFSRGTITCGGKVRGACDGCRFAALGSSPFSIARRVASMVSLPPPCDDLPPPYERRRRSHGEPHEESIWKPPVGKGAWIEVLPFDVRRARLFSFGSAAHDFIEFEARPGGKTPPRKVQLEVAAMQRGVAEFRAALAALPGGLTTPRDAEARTFFMAWLNHLRTHANVYSAGEPPAPYGWVRKDGDTPIGFAFDNVVYTKTSSYQNHRLNPLQGVYSATGELAPWHEAAQLVLKQGRPGLAAIVAAGFAGPLLNLIGIKGTVCSAYSAASGVGKTSAMRVAQAIWGQPTLGMQSLSDTEAALLKKAGLLRNLPLFWDELKSRHDLARFANTVFQLTHGREKSRATQTGALADVVEWDTLLLVAGNDCLIDVMLGQHTNTQAGALRVFEWEVEGERLEGKAVLDAASIFKRLDYHYGVVGARYAAFLGTNVELVKQVIEQTSRRLNDLLSPASEERFWIGAASALIAGAVLAERAELCRFDVAALTSHVIETFSQLRARLAEEKTYSDPKAVGGLANLVAEFLSDHADRVIVTPFMIRQGRGRVPKSLELNPLFQVKNRDLMTIRSTQPVAHYACDERRLVVSTSALTTWLRDKKRLALKAFVSQFPYAVRRNRVIGLGTEFSRRVQTDTYELDLTNCVEPAYSFDASVAASRSVLQDAVRAAQAAGQTEVAELCARHYQLEDGATRKGNVVPLTRTKEGDNEAVGSTGSAGAVGAVSVHGAEAEREAGD